MNFPHFSLLIFRRLNRSIQPANERYLQPVFYITESNKSLLTGVGRRAAFRRCLRLTRTQTVYKVSAQHSFFFMPQLIAPDSVGGIAYVPRYILIFINFFVIFSLTSNFYAIFIGVFGILLNLNTAEDAAVFHRDRGPSLLLCRLVFTAA